MGDCSHSIRLGRAIVRRLEGKYPGISVAERNLATGAPPFLTNRQIDASFKNDRDRNSGEKAALAYSDAILQEIKSADIIVLGAPMYNFGIHAALKAYIDQVVRMGETIAYGTDGIREGLLRDKTVYLAVTAGGCYNHGGFDPVKDYIVNYLSAILNYMGIHSIQPVIIEGTMKPGFTVDYDGACGMI